MRRCKHWSERFGEPCYWTRFERSTSNNKALECVHEALRRKDDHPHTYHVMAICLGHLGRIDEAQEAARRCEELRPGFFKRRIHWNIYLDPEANEHLTEGLRKAGLVE